MDGQPSFLTLPVKKGSVKDCINQKEFTDDIATKKADILALLKEVYSAAPYFDSTIAVVEECFKCDEQIVSTFIVNSLRVICSYLGVETEIISSSSVHGKKEGLRSQERVIDIIKTQSATRYINAIGGRELYNKQDFANNGMDLLFIKTAPITYDQFDDIFVPYLSIIDLMMFNSPKKIGIILDDYELV